MNLNFSNLYLVSIIVSLFSSTSIYASISIGNEAIKDVVIQVDVTKPQHVISKYLNGSHFVYGNESDNIYKDERIANWMRASEVGIIRWPGGTAVMSYHWDNLTGDNFGPDRWDVANYVEKNISPSNYMDLDEFITYCRRVNAEPMVGVNIKSGKDFKTDADGLDEARRLIQYCVSKNYNVKHWYIGNEGYAKWFGKIIYPTYIDMYAAELKKVDPNITIVGDWKFGPEDKKRYDESMYIINNSNQLDVMEYHEKWGEGWGLITGNTVAEWKSDIPLYNGRFDYYCNKFKTDVSALGKTTKLSMNEWGIGDLVDGNAYQYALLAADYMTLMYKNDIYSACYWNLNIGASKSRIFLTKNSNQSFDKFNPIEKVFRQYAPLLGGNYLEIVSSDNKVYGVASINKSKDTIQVLILNKSVEKCSVKFTLNKFNVNNTVLTDWFDELGNSMTEELAKGDLSYILPAYSFTRLQFTGNAATSLNATKQTNGDMNVISNAGNLYVYLPNNDIIKSTSVVDMKGSVVRKKNSYDNTIVLPLKGLKSGVFALLVNGEKRNYAKKIIL